MKYRDILGIAAVTMMGFAGTFASTGTLEVDGTNIDMGASLDGTVADGNTPEALDTTAGQTGLDNAASDSDGFGSSFSTNNTDGGSEGDTQVSFK